MGAPTPIGIDWLKDRIVNRSINPPEMRTLSELQGWLEGYATCQNDILDIIDEMYKEANR